HESKTRLAQATNDAALLLAILQHAKERSKLELAGLEQHAAQLEAQERSLDSQRAVLRRRLNYFVYRRAEIGVLEAESAVKHAKQAAEAASQQVRAVSFAELLSELRDREADARELEATIKRQEQEARPEREALERLGARYRWAVHAELNRAEERFRVAQQR